MPLPLIYKLVEEGKLGELLKNLTPDDITQSYLETENLLVAAIRYRHPHLILPLIEQGVDPNLMNNHQFTPLMYAARWGQALEAEILLKNGANYTLNGINYYLHLLIEGYHNSEGYENNHETTCLYDYPQTIDLFLRYGADIDSMDDNGNTLLINALARKHCLKLVENLLKKGANPNKTDKEGKLPLYYAAYWGHYQMVEHLIAFNADCNSEIINNCLNATTYAYSYDYDEVVHDYGYLTDQERADAIQEHIKLIDLFLKHGADINYVDSHGLTPLHIAVINCNSTITEHLIKKGSNINQRVAIKNKEWANYTPLHIACEVWRSKRRLTTENATLNIINQLLKNKADPNAKVDPNIGHKWITPNKNFSPLVFIITSGQQFAHKVQLLIENNADFYSPMHLGMPYEATTPLQLAADLARCSNMHECDHSYTYDGEYMHSRDNKYPYLADEKYIYFDDKKYLYRINKNYAYFCEEEYIVNKLLDAGAGIGIDLCLIPNTSIIENNFIKNSDDWTDWYNWPIYRKIFLKKISTTGVVIGMTINGIPVTRATPGFELAITNGKELVMAIQSKTLLLDYKLLLNIVTTRLHTYSTSAALKNLRNILLLYSGGLFNNCLYFINNNDNYKKQALDANLPQDITDKIEPCQPTMANNSSLSDNFHFQFEIFPTKIINEMSNQLPASALRNIAITNKKLYSIFKPNLLVRLKDKIIDYVASQHFEMIERVFYFHPNLTQDRQLMHHLLFHHAVFGQQDQVEKILQFAPDLILLNGTVIDYSNRKFIDTNIIRYLLWSKDIFMLAMIFYYLKKLENGLVYAREQFIAHAKYGISYRIKVTVRLNHLCNRI